MITMSKGERANQFPLSLAGSFRVWCFDNMGDWLPELRHVTPRFLLWCALTYHVFVRKFGGPEFAVNPHLGSKIKKQKIFFENHSFVSKDKQRRLEQHQSDAQKAW